MLNELDVLREVSRRLDAAAIPYMLTGSLAMAYDAVPRMARDSDLAVELERPDVARVEALFDRDSPGGVRACHRSLRVASDCESVQPQSRASFRRGKVTTNRTRCSATYGAVVWDPSSENGNHLNPYSAPAAPGAPGEDPAGGPRAGEPDRRPGPA